MTNEQFILQQQEIIHLYLNRNSYSVIARLTRLTIAEVKQTVLLWRIQSLNDLKRGTND